MICLDMLTDVIFVHEKDFITLLNCAELLMHFVGNKLYVI